MTVNRDKSLDWKATQEVLLNKREIIADGKNWLGHKEHYGAAKIDEMLIDGATLEEMESARGSVAEHLYHLKKEHGLPLIESGNKHMFDRTALKV